MKLCSQQQKTGVNQFERINFSNEIEVIAVSTNLTKKLSEFKSDIEIFSASKQKKSVSISINCDMPLRKYTIVVVNNCDLDMPLMFFNDKSNLKIYSLGVNHTIKSGGRLIIDLYQTSSSEIELVEHSLSQE